jgi:hypothetical protein
MLVGRAGTRAGNRLGNNLELHRNAPRNQKTRGFAQYHSERRRSLKRNRNLQEKRCPPPAPIYANIIYIYQ